MACFDESPVAIWNMVDSNAIPQGVDWDVSLAYKENGNTVNFSGYSALMQIKTDYEGEIIIELSSTDGTIVLGSGAGNTPNVILKFTPSKTSNVDRYKDMIYDLKVTSPSGIVLKFLEGQFELRRDVTR